MSRLNDIPTGADDKAAISALNLDQYALDKVDSPTLHTILTLQALVEHEDDNMPVDVLMDIVAGKMEEAGSNIVLKTFQDIIVRRILPFLVSYEPLMLQLSEQD